MLSASSSPTASLPNPARRNWFWLFFQFWFRVVFTVTFRFRVRGLEKISKTGGGLVLANHISSLDPLLVGVALQRPISYVARDTLFPLPIIGWVLRNTFVMPINRESASSQTIKRAVERMKQGCLVGIFPEGTRSRDGVLGTLKPGFIAMIRRCGVPVYPVGIAGADRALPPGVLIPRCRRVLVVYGDPLTPEELKPYLERGREEELLALVRDRLLACRQAALAGIKSEEGAKGQRPQRNKGESRKPRASITTDN